MGSRWVERGTPKGKERDFKSKTKTERNMETGFKNRRTGVRTDVHIWRSQRRVCGLDGEGGG